MRPRPRVAPIAALLSGLVVWTMAAEAPAQQPAVVALPTSERALPRPAAAEQATGELRPRLRLEAGSVLPLYVGAGLILELPNRLRLGSWFGALPGAYVDVLSGGAGLLVGPEQYGSEQAALVESALDVSLFYQASLGWRPAKGWGFYMRLGYGLATLGGSALASEVLEAATGQTLPEELGPIDVEVSSTLHMIAPEIGWQWGFGGGFGLRVGLGWAFTLSANTELYLGARQDVDDGLRAALDQIEQAGADYLDGLYTGYVHPPTLTLMLGWTFGDGTTDSPGAP